MRYLDDLSLPGTGLFAVAEASTEPRTIHLLQLELAATAVAVVLARGERAGIAGPLTEQEELRVPPPAAHPARP